MKLLALALLTITLSACMTVHVRMDAYVSPVPTPAPTHDSRFFLATPDVPQSAAPTVVP